MQRQLTFDCDTELPRLGYSTTTTRRMAFFGLERIYSTRPWWGYVHPLLRFWRPQPQIPDCTYSVQFTNYSTLDHWHWSANHLHHWRTRFDQRSLFPLRNTINDRDALHDRPFKTKFTTLGSGHFLHRTIYRCV